ncbi:hypothetical protein [Halomicrococcus gelatinilyticus]
MIQLPIRRCPACGYIGPVRRFKTESTPELTCPRCGQSMTDATDPRLA